VREIRFLCGGEIEKGCGRGRVKTEGEGEEGVEEGDSRGQKGKGGCVDGCLEEG